MTLAPRAENGRLDWLAYVRTTWPVLVGVVLAALWLQGRMESPAQKLERVRYVCSEMIAERVPPPEVTQRLRQIEHRLESLEDLMLQMISGD